MSREGCCSWPWVPSSIHENVTAPACESTQAAKHSLHTVRTNNCHLSFPRVSVGGQAQEHLHHGLASVHSARGTCPRNTLKPHGKRACATSPALLSSPLPPPNPCNCQYHPLPSPVLDTPLRANEKKKPLTEDLKWKSYKGKKPHHTTQIIVY